MGADLVAYIVKAPKHISQERLDKAADTCKKRVQRALGILRPLRSKSDATSGTRALVKKQTWLEEAAEYYPGDIEGLIDYLETVDVGQVLKNASDACRGAFRDTALRSDPDNPKYVIMTTGEMSWGDEPEGSGYQAIKNLYLLGADTLLGLR